MFGMRVEFDVKDTFIPVKVLRTIRHSVPESLWNNARQTIANHFAARARHIMMHKVSDNTAKWRRRMANKGKTVPTYVGATAPVIAGSRVGARTKTFLGDLAASRPPAVVTSVSKGPYGVNNGTLTCEVYPEAFHEEYPYRYFEPYLIERGIVPSEGIVALDEEDADRISDQLEAELVKLVEKAFVS